MGNNHALTPPGTPLAHQKASLLKKQWPCPCAHHRAYTCPCMGVLYGCSYDSLVTNQLSNLLIIWSSLSSCYPHSLHQLRVKELAELSGWNFELRLKLLGWARTQQIQEMVGSHGPPSNTGKHLAYYSLNSCFPCLKIRSEMTQSFLELRTVKSILGGRENWAIAPDLHRFLSFLGPLTFHC